MLNIFYTSQFKKDYKKAKKQGKDLNKLKEVLSFLQKGYSLPENYRDHSLTGNYIGFRECHISPDWLLIYKIDNSQLMLIVARLGSHSELF
ncbi:type II toxin-antitoxin system YafQ family toxin [Enterococcus faecium]|nr:type II toxin-antitoxin system YafQ family toxin [Enterococcus faecium]EGP4808736.1 type II toxin-antitoxin system YafQ family toxin [Enterococcus faecium]EGP5496427.1 type II toxin-antitoxin system YafQ family toxin [Enterococcus faecium]